MRVVGLETEKKVAVLIAVTCCKPDAGSGIYSERGWVKGMKESGKVEVAGQPGLAKFIGETKGWPSERKRGKWGRKETGER